jgi:sRNA-binding carbon storage regulator CsrA
MIVMSCSEQDRLLIGEDVRVDVLEIHPDFVRLAISTSDPIPAYSEETIYLNGREPADLFA